MRYAWQGSGGYGMVFEAMWRGERAAVKCLPRLPMGCPLDTRAAGALAEQHAALLHEIYLCCRFRSERLVKVNLNLSLHWCILIRWAGSHHTQLGQVMSVWKNSSTPGSHMQALHVRQG